MRRSTLALAMAAFAVLADPGHGQAKPIDDFDLARRWLTALRTGKADELGRLTALPFGFASSDREKRCEGAARTAEAFAQWTTCARAAQEALLSELEDAREMAVQPGARAERKTLQALVKRVEAQLSPPAGEKIPAGGSWTRAYFKGDGVMYNFRFLVRKTPDGGRAIAAFALDAAFEGE